MNRNHFEYHRGHRIGWLRAAVLGANDGTISIASLIVAIAAVGAGRSNILLTGVAAVAASTMSMAAGEYVSVKSQSDTENADIAREKHELESNPNEEASELTAIYVERGLDEDLASQVAVRMMEVDAFGTHAREELGITDALRAQPLQAALASALFFIRRCYPVSSCTSFPGNLDRVNNRRNRSNHFNYPWLICCLCWRGFRRAWSRPSRFLGCPRPGRHKPCWTTIRDSSLDGEINTT